MKQHHNSVQRDFAATGLVQRYLAERNDFFQAACCFQQDGGLSELEQQESALQHAYQQGWISITDYQYWQAKLDLG